MKKILQIIFLILLFFILLIISNITGRDFLDLYIIASIIIFDYSPIQTITLLFFSSIISIIQLGIYLINPLTLGLTLPIMSKMRYSINYNWLVKLIGVSIYLACKYIFTLILRAFFA